MVYGSNTIVLGAIHLLGVYRTPDERTGSNKAEAGLKGCLPVPVEYLWIYSITGRFFLPGLREPQPL